jgi:hypothetical protein
MVHSAARELTCTVLDILVLPLKIDTISSWVWTIRIFTVQALSIGQSCASVLSKQRNLGTDQNVSKYNTRRLLAILL